MDQPLDLCFLVEFNTSLPSHSLLLFFCSPGIRETSWTASLSFVDVIDLIEELVFGLFLFFIHSCLSGKSGTNGALDSFIYLFPLLFVLYEYWASSFISCISRSLNLLYVLRPLYTRVVFSGSFFLRRP